jgi:hypothetical protein
MYHLLPFKRKKNQYGIPFPFFPFLSFIPFNQKQETGSVNGALCSFHY